MLLPRKKSLNWIYVFAVVFLLNLCALLGGFTLLNSSITLNNVIGFAILALIVSLMVSLGYLGIRLFSVVVIIADLVAIAYMYIVILTNSSPGWNDLVSIVGFIFIIGLGIIVGAIIEPIYWLIKRKKGSINS